MKQSKWLELTGGAYLFGQGGITRMVRIREYNDAYKGGYRTELTSESQRYTISVKETIEEILEKLK